MIERKEAKMRFSQLGVLVVGLVVVAMSDGIRGAQDRAGGPAPAPALPYKLVEWPAPATNAAGFAAPWNLIQVTNVAVTRKGTCWCFIAARIRFSSSIQRGKLIRSWGDGMFSEGKVAGNPEDELGARPVPVLGRLRCGRDARRAVRIR